MKPNLIPTDCQNLKHYKLDNNTDIYRHQEFTFVSAGVCMFAGAKIETDNRPKRLARMMMAAELESMWSTCQRLAVGTVVFDNYGIIRLTSYNGAPSRVKHCNEMPALDGRCPICVHSETNCNNHAASCGLDVRGMNMATLYRPCVSCANNIVQARYGALYYRYDYDTDGMQDYVLDLLKNNLAHVEKLSITKQEKDFSIMLKEWKTIWQ